MSSKSLASGLLILTALFLASVASSQTSTTTPAPYPNSTQGMSPEQLKIWNSPTMLRARAWVQEYCQRSAKITPEEANQYMAEMEHMTPTQMKLWLLKFDEEEENIRQQQADFNGGGVLFALDGGRTIGNRGFSVYGKSTLSPLVGRFTSDYSLHNDTTGTQLARVHWIDDRFTTIIDYEVGLAWTGPRRRWRFAAGYTAKFWFNAVTTSTFIDAVQTNNYTNIGDTISFDGLVAHVEHLW
jgi:hypothetical protein